MEIGHSPPAVTGDDAAHSKAPVIGADVSTGKEGFALADSVDDLWGEFGHFLVADGAINATASWN